MQPAGGRSEACSRRRRSVPHELRTCRTTRGRNATQPLHSAHKGYSLTAGKVQSNPLFPFSPLSLLRSDSRRHPHIIPYPPVYKTHLTQKICPKIEHQTWGCVFHLSFQCFKRLVPENPKTRCFFFGGGDVYCELFSRVDTLRAGIAGKIFKQEESARC